VTCVCIVGSQRIGEVTHVLCVVYCVCVRVYIGSNMATPIPDARKAMNAKKLAAVEQLATGLQSKRFDVVIVGAGITGAQAAYHLLSAATGPTSILLLDSGTCFKNDCPSPRPDVCASPP
jgi:hypothetical protein